MAYLSSNSTLKEIQDTERLLMSAVHATGGTALYSDLVPYYLRQALLLAKNHNFNVPGSSKLSAEDETFLVVRFVCKTREQKNSEKMKDETDVVFEKRGRAREKCYSSKRNCQNKTILDLAQ